MSKIEKIKQHVQDLRAEIELHDRYYVLDNPTIPDAEYDYYVNYGGLEQIYPQLINRQFPNATRSVLRRSRPFRKSYIVSRCCH